MWTPWKRLGCVVRRKAIVLIASDLRRKKNTKQSGKKYWNQRKSTFFGWFLDGFPGQNLRKPMLNAASGMPNQPAQNFGGMRLPHFSTSNPQLNSPSPSPAVVWSWFWSLPEQIRNGSIPMRWSRRIYTNPCKKLTFHLANHWFVYVHHLFQSNGARNNINNQRVCRSGSIQLVHSDTLVVPGSPNLRVGTWWIFLLKVVMLCQVCWLEGMNLQWEVLSPYSWCLMSTPD